MWTNVHSQPKASLTIMWVIVLMVMGAVYCSVSICEGSVMFCQLACFCFTIWDGVKPGFDRAHLVGGGAGTIDSLTTQGTKSFGQVRCWVNTGRLSADSLILSLYGNSRVRIFSLFCLSCRISSTKMLLWMAITSSSSAEQIVVLSFSREQMDICILERVKNRCTTSVAKGHPQE